MLQAPMRAFFLLLAAVFLAPGGLSAGGGGADIGELAGRLGDSSKETRRQAAFELARLGEKAAPALDSLVEALGDRDPQVLFQVAQALAGIGPAAAPAVPGLIRNLRSGDRQVSYRSAYALGRIGSAAAPALIGELGSSSSRVRAAAARALSWVRPASPEAVERLIVAFRDDENTVRRNASEALGNYGEAVAPRLAKALGSEEDATRRGAARALSLMGSGAKPATDALAGALADKDPEVRSSAVSALSKAGLPAARLVPLLMPRLEDSEAAVRGAAVQALSRQRAADVSRELGTLLEGGGEETIQAVALVAERLGSRARAVLPGLVAAALRIDKLQGETPLARSLGVFGEEAASLILKKLAEPVAPEDTARLMMALRFTAATSVEILRDELKRGPAPARLGAAQALGAAGEPGRAALSELLGGLEDADPLLRATCIGSLAALGIPAKEYAEALFVLIEDPDEKVRAAAVSAAGKIEKNQRAQLVPILRRSLADSSVEIRRAASSSLAAMGTDAAAARPDLRAALKDADSAVRGLAARALGSMGGNGEALIAELLVLVGEKETSVRLAAVEALGGFTEGADAAAASLLELATEDKEPEVLRLASIETLARIGGPAAAQDVLASLLRESPVKVRLASARALVHCRRDNEAAVASLAVAVGDENPDVRRAAVESLGEIGPEAQGAAEALFELLGDEYSRSMGFSALKKIQPRDVALLRRALRHEDRYVRAFACDCLGKLGKGARDALDDLEKASRTRSKTLRDIVRKTIRKIEEDIKRGE